MFSMINVGERAGSGVPNILQIWNSEDWIELVIDEQFNPDRTILKLSYIKKNSPGGEHLTQGPTKATQDPAQGGKEMLTVYSLPKFDLASSLYNTSGTLVFYGIYNVKASRDP